MNHNNIVSTNGTENAASTGNDISNELAVNLQLIPECIDKIANIKGSLGGGVLGEKRAKQFENAWNITLKYSNVTEQQDAQEKLLKIKYEIGADNQVGIVLADANFDRKGYSFTCEDATKSILEKHLGGQKSKFSNMVLFPNDKGVKKGKDLKYVTSIEHAETQFFDQEESGIGLLTNNQRAGYFATVAQRKALETWSNGDGKLIASLMNLGMPFKDHNSLWLAENNTGHGCPGTIYSVGTITYGGYNSNMFFVCRGFQKSNPTEV